MAVVRKEFKYKNVRYIVLRYKNVWGFKTEHCLEGIGFGSPSLAHVKNRAESYIDKRVARWG